MLKTGVIEADGRVIESLPNTLFRVEVEAGTIPGIDTNKLVLCHMSGKMRLHYVRIMPGDRVKIEMTPYDLTKGRVILKYK
ncbi:MAG TPA: translation initiation factor IF-1 [Patescibacteria group bacterium]